MRKLKAMLAGLVLLLAGCSLSKEYAQQNERKTLLVEKALMPRIATEVAEKKLPPEDLQRWQDFFQVWHDMHSEAAK